jgi:hypothetical protein
MSILTNRFLYWTPRVLVILFAIFLSIFSFDVFSEGYGFWKTIAALLIHLVPSFIIIITLILAWRREWIGSIVYPGLAIVYVVAIGWNHNPIYVDLIFCIPLILAGVFFQMNWIYRKQLKTAF